MRRIETASLWLEPQLAAHAQELFAVLVDPALYEYEGEPPASVEALRRRLARLESRRSGDGATRWLNWVLRLRSSSALIGYVQASVTADGAAAIAYVLGSAHWGRGLASEAVRAMCAELAAIDRVRAWTAVLKRRNLRSLRLLERLGFALASPARHAALAIDADELLMERDGD